MQADVVVIGAGIAGLTTAALLAAERRDVVLLEQHGRVGGCAGDYWRKGLLFPAGATLVTGLEPGGLHDRVFARLGVRLAARPLATAMRVHLPDRVVDVPTDGAAWADERRRAFGPGGERFWRTVAERASVARALSLGEPALPPTTGRELARLARALASAVGDAGPRALGSALPWLARTVEGTMRSAGAGADRALRRFVDLQLLITMQCEADRCVALNGALALELYRFGVFWVDGGPAGAARALADAFIAHGGALRLRTRAACLEPEGDRWRVRTADGASVLARAVVLGVPLAAARALLGTRAPALLSWRSRHLPPSWGAVVLAAAVEPPPEGSPALPLYRQTVESWDRDLAEGESAFVSLYPPDERGPGARDATGLRLTVSAHTRAARWWRLATSDRTAYLAEKARVGERLMAAAERALPWIRGRIRYREVAAPPTFARYTGRPSGGVGGIPQTRGAANLLAWPTRAGVPGVYLCGDTTFPGQGTIGATLSGVNAWRAVLDDDG